MPLVVPGLQSTDGGKEDWMSKLMGKKENQTAGIEEVG